MPAQTVVGGDAIIKASDLQVSVVLPTHGRRVSLLRVLDGLQWQSVPPATFEVIVICDGDIDGSAAACRALTETLPFQIRVLEQPNEGPAVARNRGIDEARAPLIVFLDDDVVPDEHLISTHLEAQCGQDRRVTVGPLLPPPDVRLNLWGEWEERALCVQYDGIASGRWEPTYRQFYTGNASVLKKNILEVGGFDPVFRRAEDVEMALRFRDRGLHFVFLPKARGWHYVSRDFDSWVRLPHAYGEADVTMALRGRPWLLEFISGEYTRRNALVRILVESCVGRHRTSGAVVTLLSVLARELDKIGSVPNATQVCGVIYNLCYYDSVARALGGRWIFRELLHGRVSAVSLAGPKQHEKPKVVKV